jgi:cell division septal protein FtsQ
MTVLIYAERGKETRIRRLAWAGLILASLVLIFGFVFDYSRHMLAHFSLFGMMQVKDPKVLEVATMYIPHRFPWWIFCTGELIILTTIGFYVKRIAR